MTFVGEHGIYRRDEVVIVPSSSIIQSKLELYHAIKEPKKRAAKSQIIAFVAAANNNRLNVLEFVTTSLSNLQK